jgi:hypothetical protein
MQGKKRNKVCRCTLAHKPTQYIAFFNPEINSEFMNPFNRKPPCKSQPRKKVPIKKAVGAICGRILTPVKNGKLQRTKGV